MTSGDAIGWELIEKIKQKSQWRREHPDEWFEEIAADLWQNMEDDEALSYYRMQLENVPWWAGDVVECLEGVLRDRPDWAVTRLVEGMRAGPWLGPVTDPEPYYAWIAKQAKPMREAFDRASKID